MDVIRPSRVRQRRIRRLVAAAAASAIALLITLGLSRLKPAAPAVERATVWIDTVKRGPMVRQVRGLGTLVPEDLRWIPATTTGRVERIVLRPGTAVRPDTVILELSNPALEQEFQGAQLKVRAAEAALENLRVDLENDDLQRQASIATIEADYRKAALQADVNEQLATKQLVSGLVLKQSKLDAEHLAARYQIASKQLASHAASLQARLAVQQSEVDQARAVMRLKERQVAELWVRAGAVGVLQLVPVDVGQQVAPGTYLARVADPTRLKAELKIPETQAKDIQIGQLVEIDTRNGIAAGRVARIDPAVQNGTVTVDVTISGDLPKGARPDLTVDGTIELERLKDILFVGRPASSQENAIVSLFKLQPDGIATRAQVRLGRRSVTTVEVISGLEVGEQVVLSDMSAWDSYDRVRIK